jgi:hypothetical protein
MTYIVAQSNGFDQIFVGTNLTPNALRYLCYLNCVRQPCAPILIAGGAQVDLSLMTQPTKAAAEDNAIPISAKQGPIRSVIRFVWQRIHPAGIRATCCQTVKMLVAAVGDENAGVSACTHSNVLRDYVPTVV